MNSAIKAYQQAAESQVEQLILDNLDFVRKILSTMTAGLPESCDRENLEQSGMVGLIEAARKFDGSRQVSFRTFAFTRIRGAIIDEMRRNSLIPQKVLEQISRVKRAYETSDGPVTPETLAQNLGLKVEEVVEILETMRFVKPESWNDLETQLSSLTNRVAGTPDEELQKAEMKGLVADCIEKLPEQERLTLTLYFAEDLTLAEIGQVINLSESRVSRILASAKFRLKEMIEHAIR